MKQITAMLRVRNEERWLAEVLASIQPLTADILIFDDHSTDGTTRIAREMGADVLPSPYDGTTDEVRDKNCLLDFLRQTRPGTEYVLCIDGDEVLEYGSAGRIREKLRPDLGLYSFPIRYLWNDRLHYRADGVYSRYTRASMFSLVDTGPLAFKGTKYGCNFHCGNIPQGLRGGGATIPVDLLHLGYMDREDRIRKYHWYNERDPNNTYEDQYRHMVIGDVFPSDSRFVHGGPLKVFTLPPSKWGPVT